MNTDLKKQRKNYFEKDFFKLMNNSVFGKTLENVQKHKDSKIITTEKKLFGVRIILSYYKVFYRKFIDYGHEKNSNTCE